MGRAGPRRRSRYADYAAFGRVADRVRPGSRARDGGLGIGGHVSQAQGAAPATGDRLSAAASGGSRACREARRPGIERARNSMHPAFDAREVEQIVDDSLQPLAVLAGPNNRSACFSVGGPTASATDGSPSAARSTASGTRARRWRRGRSSARRSVAGGSRPAADRHPDDRPSSSVVEGLARVRNWRSVPPGTEAAPPPRSPSVGRARARSATW